MSIFVFPFSTVTTIGSDSNNFVSFGGTLNVRGNGEIINTQTDPLGFATSTINVSTAAPFFFAPVADLTTVNFNGILEVGNGGTSYNTIVNNGGIEAVDGLFASANYTIVNGNGEQDVYWGTANYTLLNDVGAFQYLGEDGFGNYGTGIGTEVNAYTSVLVEGGSLFDAIVHGNGYVEVDSGPNYFGDTTNTLLRGDSDIAVANEWVYNGTAFDTTVDQHGVLYLTDYDATSFNTVVNAQGYELVEFGTSNDATVNFGGSQLVWDSDFTPGFETGAFNTYLNGGVQIVEGPDYFLGDGRADGTTIDGGGTQVVDGFSYNTDILVGTQIVWFEGEDYNAYVAAGGFQFVNGGFADGTTIEGTQFVQAGGEADFAYVAGGAVQSVSDGGFTFASYVDRFGTLVVDGTSSDAGSDIYGDAFIAGFGDGEWVYQGGQIVVQDGGFIDNTNINGGQVVIQDGADGGLINFNQFGVEDQGGVLVLESSQDFTGEIVGFNSVNGDTIDLQDIAFTAQTTATWTQNGTSGTLSVTDGTNTANLSLLGFYSTANFTLSSDGAGGTFVVDPAADQQNPVLAAAA